MKKNQTKLELLNCIRERVFLNKTKVKTAGLLLLVLLSVFSVTGCNEKDLTLEYIITEKTDPTPDETLAQYDVPFGNIPQTSDIAMYEINPMVFSSNGNLEGIEARLDSIKNLGINVIWLMPIHPIGELNGVGSPYCVKNYTEINSDYGSLEDLRKLVKEAHSRNMAVIMDWVANHTAWDNAWVENKSWYTQDDSGNIISPSGMGWDDVADLNYSSTDMRNEMISAMKYWILTANIDGYRCDYAEGVPADFWKQAIDTLRNIPDREIIMFAEATDKDLYSSGFDMVFGWDFYGKLKEIFTEAVSASELTNANTSDYTDIPSGSEIIRFTTNHDFNSEESPISIFKGNKGSMAAFVLSSYMGGVPLLYNGQEVGCPVELSFFSGGTTKIDWSINPEIWVEYKKLMNFRNNSNAVKTGSIESFSNNEIVAFKRISEIEEVLIIVNVRETSVDYQIPASLSNTNWKHALDGSDVLLENSISMQAFSYLILKN